MQGVLFEILGCEMVKPKCVREVVEFFFLTFLSHYSDVSLRFFFSKKKNKKQKAKLLPLRKAQFGFSDFWSNMYCFCDTAI